MQKVRKNKMKQQLKISIDEETLKWIAIEAKDKAIAGLKEQISSLKSKVREFTDFVFDHGLMEAFKEFIRPKSMKEKLEIGKQKSREMESQKRNLTVITDKKHDIAI